MLFSTNIIPNTRLQSYTNIMAGLINASAELPAWRERLFAIHEPVMLSHSEFETYWPYVDNIWSKKRQGPVNKASERVVYYIYRLGRKENTPWSQENASKGLSSVKKHRNKPIRMGETCRARLKVTVGPGETPVYRLEQQDGIEHSHSLQYSDALKTNSALMSVAAAESSKNYSPAIIIQALRGNA